MLSLSIYTLYISTIGKLYVNYCVRYYRQAIAVVVNGQLAALACLFLSLFLLIKLVIGIDRETFQEVMFFQVDFVK